MEIQDGRKHHLFIGSCIGALGLIALIPVVLIHPSKPIFLIMALLFIAAGIWVLVTAVKVHTSIRDGIITVTTTRYFGGNSSQNTYNFADVQAIQYFEWTTPSSAGNAGGSDLVMQLKNGSSVTLIASQKHVNFFTNTPISLKDLAVQASALIGVPLKEGLEGPTNLSNIMQ